MQEWKDVIIQHVDREKRSGEIFCAAVDVIISSYHTEARFTHTSIVLCIFFCAHVNRLEHSHTQHRDAVRPVCRRSDEQCSKFFFKCTVRLVFCFNVLCTHLQVEQRTRARFYCRRWKSHFNQNDVPWRLPEGLGRYRFRSQVCCRDL